MMLGRPAFDGPEERMSRGAVKWDDLRVFLEVARQGSVHAAAKRLKVDHSTVCRRIGKLESMLSIKLLDRTQRGILVREGVQAVIAHIERMETHANSLEDAIAASRAEATQIVRIATMEGIASRYVARRISLLDRFARNVKIELVSIPQPVDLSRKEADVFLSFFNPHLSGLSSRKIGHFALFLYCAPSYATAHGLPTSRDDLAQHVFVDYIEDLLAIDAVRWLREAIASPRVAFYSNSVIAQCAAAEAGLGIVMLPTFVAAGIRGLMRIVPHEVSIRRDVWVSVRHEQASLSRIKSVLQFLTHIFQKDEAFLMGASEELG
jgi:DNA-binding transcriptional LysR family regulator